MAERRTVQSLATEIEKELANLRNDCRQLREEINRADLVKILERLAVIELQVAEFKRQKDDADKRGWQWVYIGIGFVVTLTSGALMQLLAYALRK